MVFIIIIEVVLSQRSYKYQSDDYFQGAIVIRTSNVYCVMPYVKEMPGVLC